MGYYDKAKAEKELAHHGVMGMHWGVRRFQNKDGSLTAQGKARLVSKTNKKHKFVDKSEVSINKRKDTLDGVLAIWGMTAVSGAGGAAMLAPLGPLGALVGAGVMSTPWNLLAVGATADFVAKDVAANKAVKKEKQFEEERAKNPIDKKTGFHKKTTEMSASEDMERVNPGFKDWDENTKSNCVLCSMSMELRRRGYDVQAKKATSGYNGNEIVKDWFPGAKPKESEGSMSETQLTELWRRGLPPKTTKENQQKMITNTVSEIEKQPEGARGQICVTWDGSFSGHSMAYANEGGKAVIYDTQANKRYEGKEVEKLLKQTSICTVTRLDNCDMNLKYIKEVAK